MTAPQPPQTTIQPPAEPASAPTFSDQVAGLPEDMRGNVNVTRHENLESLVKDHLNAQEMLGRKGIAEPNTEDVHDVHRFLKDLGRPDTPEQYDIGNFEIPDGLPWDQDLQTELIRMCHDCGITQGQLEKLLPAYAQLQDQSFRQVMQGSETHHQEQIESLKAEMGSSFEASVNLGSRAMAHVFKGDAQGLLQARLADGSVLGNHPGFVRGMVEIGKLVGEDSLAAAGHPGSGVPTGLTPEAARHEIAKLENDKEFQSRYLDNNHTGHAEANAQLEALYAQAHPPQRGA